MRRKSAKDDSVESEWNLRNHKAPEAAFQREVPEMMQWVAGMLRACERRRMRWGSEIREDSVGGHRHESVAAAA